MLASMCSASGPLVTPKNSAIWRPGNAVFLDRRKNSPASWSRTMYASGDLASQPRWRVSASCWW